MIYVFSHAIDSNSVSRDLSSPKPSEEIRYVSYEISIIEAVSDYFRDGPCQQAQGQTR